MGDICQVIFRDMGSFSKNSKGYWIIPGTPLPGPHIYLPNVILFLFFGGNRDTRTFTSILGDKGTGTYTLGEIQLQMSRDYSPSHGDIFMYYSLLSNSYLHDSSDINRIISGTV